MTINPKVAHTEIGGTIILLNSGEDKTYHELNGTASLIWKGLIKKESPEQIADILTEEFELSKKEALDDIHSFIGELRDHQLILA